MELRNFLKNFDEEGFIILLEGKRNVHPEDEPKLTELGIMLCKKLKFARFRSGNASGADYFFCKGVSDIDSKRLELVLPYSSHRKNYLLSDNFYSIDEMDLHQEPEVVYQTKSNQKNKSLIDLYISGYRGKAGIKGSYLIRDTIKVSGTNTGISKATFAIFYDDLCNPKSGGTGHTMQMCDINNIPYVDQTTWFNWI